MKRFLKLLFIVGIFALFTLSFAACDSGGGSSFSFDDYGFTNKATVKGDWRDIKYDEDMKIDGKLDESVWRVLSASEVDTGNAYADKVTLKTKIYFGEKGIFIGMESDETHVYYKTGVSTIFDNTSVELYITPTDSIKLANINTVQLRYSVNGDTEQWVARLAKADQTYKWTQIYIKTMSRVIINGELNTNTCNGFTMEAFLNYEELGITDGSIPEELLVFSAFNRRLDNVSNVRHGWHGQSKDINALTDYYIATHDGVTSNRIRHSGGFIQTGENTYFQRGDDEQYMFVHAPEEAGTKYYLEAQASINGTIFNNALAPRFGIMAARNEEAINYEGDINNYYNTIGLFVEPTGPNLNAKNVTVVQRNAANTNWDTALKTTNMPEISYKDGDSVKLAVLRDGANFYFFADGKPIYYKSDFRYLDADVETSFGFFVRNLEASFEITAIAFGADVNKYYSNLIVSDLSGKTVEIEKGTELDLSSYSFNGYDKSGTVINSTAINIANSDFILTSTPVFNKDMTGTYELRLTHKTYSFMDIRFTVEVTEAGDADE